MSGILALAPEEQDLIKWMKSIETCVLEEILNKGKNDWYVRVMSEEVKRRRNSFFCSDCKDHKPDVEQRLFEDTENGGTIILDLCESCWEKRM